MFTVDKPIIFAFHGYPSLIHRLTYRRTGHHNIHVRGYKEEGTTTTPFDMCVLNDLDRFHLVSDVIDRVPKLGARAAYAKQVIRDKLIDHREFIARIGDDMPEITGWRWGQAAAPPGAIRQTPTTSERAGEREPVSAQLQGCPHAGLRPGRLHGRGQGRVAGLFPDYLQRSARHIASKTDVDQAYAVGCAAVQFAVAGRSAVMPAIRRLSDAPYRWDIVEAPLSEVANREKHLPAEFISADGFGITEAARRYLAPLIVGEAYPPYKEGLPDYVRLQNAAVPKKLAAEFAV